ncbi:MAG TPA: hypothetical protein VM120_12300 [Bryobacteraceae bacterium]|nr:hypothetical protein [Bryobacteraceae bacterium]
MAVDKTSAFKLHLLNEMSDRGVNDSDVSNGWDDTKRTEIKKHVIEYLNLIIAEANCPFGSTDVTLYSTAPANPQPPDVLMTFRLRRKSEIVKKGQTLKHGDAAGGATFDTGSGIVSEIFPEGASGDANFTKLVAGLVIHELIHIKCDTGKGAPLTDIHTAATGLDKAVISSRETMTDGCKKRIAPQLGRKVQTIVK